MKNDGNAGMIGIFYILLLLSVHAFVIIDMNYNQKKKIDRLAA